MPRYYRLWNRWELPIQPIQVRVVHGAGFDSDQNLSGASRRAFELLRCQRLTGRGQRHGVCRDPLTRLPVENNETRASSAAEV